jgi:hypothetical protein
MRDWKIRSIATLVSCGALLTPLPSWACGGCFHPVQSSASSTVTGHRMAFAVSQDRTVLWDQFEYSGAPEDFSWVLPVLPGAYVEESTDAWFESLETVTQTQITSPAITCANGGGSGCGAGFGASADASASPSHGFDGGGGVTVLHKGTVGPYETVTLRSTQGDVLSAWLTAHGYAIPPNIEPIIAAYVAEGDDFVAVRLQPGLGVNAMTPVRVVTPGGEYLLPLRMVAAGVGLSVNIVLYVIGEQRYAMPDLHEVTVDDDQLVWKFADNSNNYAELRRDALADFFGFSYLPTFAFRGAFSRTFPSSNGFSPFYSTTSGQSGGSTLSQLYFAQARDNDGNTATACPDINTQLTSNQLVTEGTTGGFPSSTLTCGKYSDIAAAMIGMHPSKVWLTRLELDLPLEALGADCTVVPADSQAEVNNQHQVVHASDRPAGCEEVVFESRMSAHPPTRLTAWLVLALAGVSLWLRRRGAR